MTNTKKNCKFKIIIVIKKNVMANIFLFVFFSFSPSTNSLHPANNSNTTQTCVYDNIPVGVNGHVSVGVYIYINIYYTPSNNSVGKIH